MKLLKPSLLLACVLCACSAPCTEDDIRTVFTECYKANGMEYAEVLQHWTTDCEATNVTLAPPRSVPCNVHCPNGMFYSTDAVCEPCAPGTYSISDTVTHNNFEEIPKEMITYCHSYRCAKWEATDGILTSGDNSYTPDAESHLVFFFDVPSERSYITVQYRIESDRNAASMQVYLDDVQQWTYPTITGIDFSWDTFSTTATGSGSHMLRFSYMKNKADPVGSDRAFIKSITIDGQRSSVTECTTCPIGYVAENSNSSACDLCPAKTRRGLNDPATTCIPCGAGKASASGSDTCYEIECEFPMYGPCEMHEGGLKRKAHWQDECMQSGKSDTYEDCGECLEGYYRDTTTGQCVHCPSGQYRKDGTCATCQDGYFAHPKLLFDGFATAEGVGVAHGLTQDDKLIIVANSCTGECREADTYGDNGWEVKRKAIGGANIVALSSGKEQGNRVDVALELRFNATASGHINFKYTFAGDTSCSTGYFYVDSQRFTLDLTKSDLSQDPIGTFTELDGSEEILLEARTEYTLKWEFFKQCSGTHIGELLITELVLHGIEGGAGSSCVECPEGHMCTSSAPLPVPCPPGKYQADTMQATCNVCPPNSITQVVGQVSCRDCGPAVANAERTRCNAACKFTDADLGLTYDMTPIGKHLFGPIVDKDHLIYKNQTEHFPLDADTTNQTLDDAYSLQRYMLKICEIVNDEDDEQELCPSEKQAYACQRLDAQRAYSMGDFPEYEPSPRGMNITITGGSMCWKYRNGKRVDPWPRQTLIELTCDLSATSLSPEMRFIGEGNCAYSFEVSTAYVCPICQDDDFISVSADCDLVTQEAEVTWVRKAGKVCLGERAPTTKSCRPSCREEDWVVGWEECTSDGNQMKTWLMRSNVSCVDDLNTRPESDGELRSCIGSNKMVLAVIIFLCIVILLIMVLCLTYRKKKLMETKYSRLAAQDRDVPMSSFPHVEGDVMDDDLVIDEDYETHNA